MAALPLALILLVSLTLAETALSGCTAPVAETQLKRSFQTSFEALEDFKGFYLSPQGHVGTTWHELSTEQVRTGLRAHKAWTTGHNPESTWLANNNHRGYPTIQLHKRPGGGYRTPCRIEFWVWLDVALRPGEWFSFATLTPDASDAWKRTVLVNLSDEGFVHLMHVPRQGEGTRSFQTTSVPFPMRTWVKLSITLRFGAQGGEVRVLQNDSLVSQASLEPMENRLEQAHFGLYAPPAVASCSVFNDDLTIQEL